MFYSAIWCDNLYIFRTRFGRIDYFEWLVGVRFVIWWAVYIVWVAQVASVFPMNCWRWWIVIVATPSPLVRCVPHWRWIRYILCCFTVMNMQMNVLIQAIVAMGLLCRPTVTMTMVALIEKPANFRSKERNIHYQYHRANEHTLHSQKQCNENNRRHYAQFVHDRQQRRLESLNLPKCSWANWKRNGND